VTVARDDLGRDRLDGETHFLRHMRLDGRIDAGERADRAGDGAGGDLGPRRLEASPVALELDIVAEKLEAEGGRLGMDAVATADTRRRLVLEGTPFQHR